MRASRKLPPPLPCCGPAPPRSPPSCPHSGASADQPLTDAVHQLARLILGLDNPNPDERPTAEQAGKLIAFFEAAGHADQQSMHLSQDERDNAIQQAMVAAARELGIPLKQCSSCQATSAGPGYSDWHEVEHGGGHLCQACHDEQLQAQAAAEVAPPRLRTLEDAAVCPATTAGQLRCAAPAMTPRPFAANHAIMSCWVVLDWFGQQSKAQCSAKTGASAGTAK